MFEQNARTQSILVPWLEKIKKSVPSAAFHDDIFLIDHMPEYLSSLYQILDRSEDSLRLEGEVLKNAGDHGAQRATSLHYSVSEVVMEFTLLRESFLAEAKNSLEFDTNLQLTRIIEASIGASTEEFVSQRTAPRHNALSEARFRSVFSHAAVGFIVSTFDGKILEVNPKFCEMTGYTAAELHKISLNTLVYSEDQAREREVLELLTGGGSSHQVIEKRFITKSGGIIWLRNSVSLDLGLGGDGLLIRVCEDVTEIRKASELRAESEARFVTLANSMPQIVWTAHPDGRLDYFNQVWFDYSGTTYEDNKDNGWASSVHEEDRPQTASNWESSLRSGSIYENEFRLRSKSGEYRWFVARAVPTRDESGNIIKWYGTNTDIHSSKTLAQKLTAATQALEAEKLKFQTIFKDSSTSMAILKGENFVYEVANQSYIELFNNRDLIGKPFLEALPELVDQEFPKLARSVFETGVPYIEREAVAFLRRTDTGDLEMRNFDQSYTLMSDQSGNPYGVFIHAQEVTDRVVARRSLEETMERLNLALEAANMGTWELKIGTGEVIWSKRTRELFGINHENKIFLNEIIPNIHAEDRDRVNAAIAAAIDPNGSGHYDIRYRIVRSENDIRWVSLLGKTFFAETPNGRVATRFSGTVLDVTDTMLAEQQLKEAKRRAEIASEAKSSFLANMSHEIRTPLGAIMGFVNLLGDESLERQDMVDYLGVVERNSTQLLRIIDDILDLSKVEAGMIVIEHIDFSLLEVLADFSSLMGFRARENGIDFVVRAETAIPDPVLSDPTRIRQILNNIVGNAIKFTSRGRVELNVSYADNFLTFKIIDTGRGISADQVKDLFQPFAQADASTTRKFGGTGLGLVLTRKLCEVLGGDFWLEHSELGKGSTFVARIRVDVPERSKLVVSSDFSFTTEVVPLKDQRKSTLQGMKILIVEDSPDNRLLIRVLLTRFGAEVSLAGDGVEGVAAALREDFDVVLMDVQMPRMDGYAAVRELRERSYTKPIIALTAHAMKEEREKCLEAGYTEFLTKPINQVELIDTVKRFR